MKKLFWMAGLMMLAACSSQEMPTDGMPEEEAYRTVVAKATLPGGESRLVLTEEDGKTIKVDWEESGEAFSVMTGTSDEDPVTFNQNTGDEFTGEIPAGWTGSFYAFYPELKKDEDGNYLPSMYTEQFEVDPITTVSAEKVPFDLVVQTGKLEDLSPLMSAVSKNGENYAFKHLTAIVKLTLTGMDAVKGKPVLGVILMGPNTMGYYNLKTKEISLLDESMEGMTLGVQIMTSSQEENLVVSEDGSVSVYLCLPPVPKDTPLQTVVTVMDEEEKYMNINVALTQDLEAGKYYRVTREVKTMEELCNFTADSPEDLMEFAKASNENVMGLPMSLTLTDDIDMNGQTWTPINQENGNFPINIDGGGHTIKNLTVNGGEGDYCGFIANLNDGSNVLNLHFENIDVKGPFSGGIAGRMGESSLIAGCSVSGQVTGNDAGGIAYYNVRSFIEGCLNAATVKAGESGTSNSGGIAGQNDGEIVGCINTGKLIKEGGCGAIVGYNHNAAKVSNCYWSGDMAAGIDNDTQSTATTKVEDWTTFDFTDLNNVIAEIGFEFVLDETTKQPKVQKKTTGE